MLLRVSVIPYVPIYRLASGLHVFYICFYIYMVLYVPSMRLYVLICFSLLYISAPIYSVYVHSMHGSKQSDPYRYVISVYL